MELLYHIRGKMARKWCLDLPTGGSCRAVGFWGKPEEICLTFGRLSFMMDYGAIRKRGLFPNFTQRTQPPFSPKTGGFQEKV